MLSVGEIGKNFLLAKIRKVNQRACKKAMARSDTHSGTNVQCQPLILYI